MMQGKKEIKKEAGELVQFRTSDLSYGSGSTIAIGDDLDYNIYCNGSDLLQFAHSAIVRSHITSGDYCIGSVFDDLPGSVGGPPEEPVMMYRGSGYYSQDGTAFVVCQKDGVGGRWQTQYMFPSSGTESPISIDPTREVFCPITVYDYQYFTEQKNIYLDGGDFNTFITDANSWLI